MFLAVEIFYLSLSECVAKMMAVIHIFYSKTKEFVYIAIYMIVPTYILKKNTN